MAFFPIWFRFIVALPLLGTIAVPCAANTVIDFETPDVSSAWPQVINPYAASGVTFSSYDYCNNASLGLILARGDQKLATGYGRSIPRGDHIRVDFPPEPADPVFAVQADVFPLPDFTEAWISLHRADGTEITYASGTPEQRTLRAVGSERVAFAKIDAYLDDADCGAVVQCGPCRPGFAIDNFIFGDCLDTEVPIPTVTLSASTLWPPSHELVEIHATVTVVDDCDQAPQVKLLSITSDEPDLDTGLEDLPGDIVGAEVGVPDLDFALRAERGEDGDGRTYTACYEARDESGRTAQACAGVDVPHDSRRWEAPRVSSPAMEIDGLAWAVVGMGPSGIAYRVPRAAHVRLRLFDVSGRLVANLVEGSRPAGTHYAALPPGLGTQVCLYRLEWEGGRATGKIAVLR